MAVEAKRGHGKPPTEGQPLAHLRAAPEERARILAAAAPFDAEAWQREAVQPTPEELADLEEFLREREEMRRIAVERLTERTG
jgi:hypothetical protein